VTLDLTRLSSRIDDLAGVTDFAASEDSASRLADAFQTVDVFDLSARLTTAKTSWLLAQPGSSFQGAIPASPPPDDYSVVASDGSFILPDRHSPARFYVINIGKVLLRYGAAPFADITADAEVYFRENELYVPDQIKRIPINGTLLGFKRAAAELAAVADVAAAQDGPVLALQDGTLILWGLETYPDPVVDWILESYLGAMETLKARGIPVASFISYPSSTDVVNSVRVSVCDYPLLGKRINCDDCQLRVTTENHIAACEFIPDVNDRMLFDQIAPLRPGERSQVYASRSKILEQYGHDQHIHFFYVNTGAEIARVEIPRWVARDEAKLQLTHSAIFDQCSLGRGYPTALQEAHEVAAIRPDERRAVETLAEEALARRGLVYRRSAKDESKRGRFV